jgi:hypothetical protein
MKILNAELERQQRMKSGNFTLEVAEMSGSKHLNPLAPVHQNLILRMHRG